MTFADRLKISSVISFSLLAFVGALLAWSSGQFSASGERLVFERVRVQFDQSVLISRRLVERVQGISINERDMVHTTSSPAGSTARSCSGIRPSSKARRRCRN